MRSEIIFMGRVCQVPGGFSLREVFAPSFAEFRTWRWWDGQERGSFDVVEVAFTAESQVQDHMFLVCPTAMAAVRGVPILHFRNSNQHFAVGFFLNPALRPLLEALFPDRNVFHLLAQRFLHPSDAVWGQLKSFHDQYLRGASRTIGVQLRESKGEYRRYFDDDDVPLCIQRNSALCPIELEAQIAKEKTLHLAQLNSSSIGRPLVSVHVSSLAGGHYQSLKHSVANLEPEMLQRFVVVAQDADGEQRGDMRPMQKALVDILVLSLSDTLITSHMSTFGYTAHGLAGITPLHLKPWLDLPCWRNVFSDPCFHFAPQQVHCPKDNFTMRDPIQQASSPSAPTSLTPDSN